MKTSQKCIKCFFTQIDKAASLAKLGKRKREELFLCLTRKLLDFDFNQPPVAFGRIIYKTTSGVSGIKDIFGREKIKAENYLIRHTGLLEKILKRAKDPLYTAAKLASAANAIDFGAGKTPDLDKFIAKIEKVRLKVNHFAIFKERLKKAKKVLIIGDNCGEALFDKLFIREILKFNPKLLVGYAVRSSPMINDVLLSDARRVGIDSQAKIISSGCDYPGLILSKTSSYFKKIYNCADLIISKGQGNFESLEDKKDIFYLFKIKCSAVSDFLNLPVDSLLFLYNKYMVQ